jgi:hypothetical protein
MDQFTDDDLGLKMLANPNRMNDDIPNTTVNMDQDLFVDETENIQTDNNYFHHDNEKTLPQFNFNDDNMSDVSKVSMEPSEDVLRKKNFLLTKFLLESTIPPMKNFTGGMVFLLYIK